MSGKVSLVKKTPSVSQSSTTDAPGAADPKSGQPGSNDGLTFVIARNAFYLINGQKMMMVLIGQFFLIMAMIAVIIKLTDFTDSRDHFFPAQTDNTIIVEKPLFEPVYSEDQIRTWVENSVTRTLTFGFYDHLIRLQDSRIYFTRDGWASFTKAMNDAEIFERIGAVKSSTVVGVNQVVSAKLRPGEKPTITAQGILRGRYTWKVSLLLDVTFNNKAVESRFTWAIDTVVTRLPLMESREGIGISQLVARTAIRQ
jgi:hypothetical protein